MPESGKVKVVHPSFKYRVAERPGGENLKACFACGVCTAICPVAEIDPQYNPRRIVRMVLLGLEREVLSSPTIWLCATCYRCQAHCPQDVRFTEVMGVLREMAVERGYADPSLPEKIDQIDLEAQKIRRQMVLEMLAGLGRTGEATS